MTSHLIFSEYFGLKCYPKSFNLIVMFIYIYYWNYLNIWFIWSKINISLYPYIEYIFTDIQLNNEIKRGKIINHRTTKDLRNKILKFE